MASVPTAETILSRTQLRAVVPAAVVVASVAVGSVAFAGTTSAAANNLAVENSQPVAGGGTIVVSTLVSEARATCEDGVCRIVLPKRENQRRRTIAFQ
ncbi:MAG: hypothetical protein ABEJ42_09575 [Halobacteriaceae archaeon]